MRRGLPMIAERGTRRQVNKCHTTSTWHKRIPLPWLLGNQSGRCFRILCTLFTIKLFPKKINVSYGRDMQSFNKSARTTRPNSTIFFSAPSGCESVDGRLFDESGCWTLESQPFCCQRCMIMLGSSITLNLQVPNPF
ncbi:hypothetical protein PAXRUDRAFT_451597 [Paxillus rubicundulus Ve08.2h10]|uniref:Uncharacterized protein n=1 Tax=Paxillus rubicundulus Ve08.2h10 TaxID=930991 RepID=A0A0D0D759_9AGAM|nr:hypothetical protein PAXRUDRAFT_451597 [Paxillus rubicundulus Ve08.2h10]